MEEAVRMSVEAAQAAGGRRIAVLRLRVGRLGGAVPEALQFAWDIVRRDTLANDARLDIESIPAVAWCAGCRREFECKDLINECPACGAISGDLRRGRELEIAAVELE